jgi:hypothetical protein
MLLSLLIQTTDFENRLGTDLTIVAGVLAMATALAALYRALKSVSRKQSLITELVLGDDERRMSGLREWQEAVAERFDSQDARLEVIEASLTKNNGGQSTKDKLDRILSLIDREGQQ